MRASNFNLLSYIKINGACTQSDLELHPGIAPTKVPEFLRGCTRHGLLNRGAGGRFTLTKKGVDKIGRQYFPGGPAKNERQLYRPLAGCIPKPKNSILLELGFNGVTHGLTWETADAALLERAANRTFVRSFELKPVGHNALKSIVQTVEQRKFADFSTLVVEDCGPSENFLNTFAETYQARCREMGIGLATLRFNSYAAAEPWQMHCWIEPQQNENIDPGADRYWQQMLAKPKFQIQRAEWQKILSSQHI